jgi:hypothetical protein
MQSDLLGILALLLVAGSMAHWFRRIQRVDIPRDRRGYAASWLFASAMGITALITGAGWIGGIAGFLAAAAGLIFSALVFISPQRAADDVVRVGERLRAFSALDEFGNDFSISNVGGSAVLLKFFRGHW